MGEVYPLLLDGPLKGYRIAMPSPPGPHVYEAGAGQMGLYEFHRYRILGVVLWVGRCDAKPWSEPTAENLAALAASLVSDRAIEASETVPGEAATDTDSLPNAAAALLRLTRREPAPDQVYLDGQEWLKLIAPRDLADIEQAARWLAAACVIAMGGVP